MRLDPINFPSNDIKKRLNEKWNVHILALGLSFRNFNFPQEILLLLAVSEHFLLYFERFYFDNDFFKNIPCQEQDQEEEQQNYNNKAF